MSKRFTRRARQSWAHQLGLVALLVLLALGIDACVTEQIANRSVFDNGARGDAAVKVGRLPACEKGQVAGEGGKCLDVLAPARDGQPATVRERLLLQECEQAKGYVVAAVRRRDEVVSVKGHDVHLGLNAIVSECNARQTQLDVCTRAGRYGPDSPHRTEEVRLRDGLSTCYQLADVYRGMLGQGLRRAP